MKIDVLSIADCPNGDTALARVQEAIQALGLSKVELHSHVLRSSADAARWAFAGSPTILIDGSDAFPSDGRTAELACRVYPGELALEGAPSREQLVAALRMRLS
ncbi:hypothetical protein EV379_2796 [Microterricola gilva]|uniref:Thioredoxin-like protein n=1 Tax=Microterricola gilva TaxID=393267 RepID=A0A4Q8AP37_9MICO|nr:hypothetical protein [Microterricola gilva]RZU66440.1 hypothetical protein EV379_2796 [Microterricola gilva]